MLTVLILAAGDSTRFRSLTKKPKQFISWTHNHTEAQMWEHSISGLTIPARVFVAIQEIHKDYLECDESVTPIYLPKTRGQLDTLILSLDYIQKMYRNHYYDLNDLLVVNCDSRFDSGILDNLVISGRSICLANVLVFNAPASEQERWSFINRIWTNGRYLIPFFDYAEEKKYISNLALAGAYYFSYPGRLKKEAIQIKSNGELYISQIFGKMHQRKDGALRYVEIPRSAWHDWGTPESFLNDIEGANWQ